MNIKLLSCTKHIHETLDIIWQVSKTADNIDFARPTNRELLQKLVDENVPVLRHFYFTFIIEGMPIEFREQLVRSQYDHYWIQSGRITDWTNMEIQKNDLGQELNDSADAAERAILDFIQLADAKGKKPEDYRFMVPVGALHRGIWTANLESIISRFKKRSCWVAQNVHWTPVLAQIKELIEEELEITLPMRPPCMKRDGTYTRCPFKGVMEDRALGRDPLPTCPLFISHEGGDVDFGEDWDLIPPPDVTLYKKVMLEHWRRVMQYERMWDIELPRS